MVSGDQVDPEVSIHLDLGWKHQLVSRMINNQKFTRYKGFQYFLIVPVYVLHYLQVVLFDKNLSTFHEYLIQHFKNEEGDTKDDFSRVKVPGTAPY
jgi:hypothetical protein